MKPPHIIWDWNGTIFSDLAAIVAASNDCLAPYSVPAITPADFRKTFRRPLEAFYANLIGRPLEIDEWEKIFNAWSSAYQQHSKQCALAPDIREALVAWQAAGNTQSLLSMMAHDPLVSAVAGFQLTDFFTRIDGQRFSYDTTSKTRYLLKHLTELQLEPSDVIMIGDTTDDYYAAAEVGTRIVLYNGGIEDLTALREREVPIVDSSTTALEYINGQ